MRWKECSVIISKWPTVIAKPLRILLIIAIFLGCYVLCWLVLLFSSLGLLGGAANLIALLVAIYVAYRIWPKTETWPQSVIGWTLLGAMLLGTAGFIGGFFGPILWAPQANQGPLLGIFITGPLGFLTGGLLGLLMGLKQRHQKISQEQ